VVIIKSPLPPFIKGGGKNQAFKCHIITKQNARPSCNFATVGSAPLLRPPVHEAFFENFMPPAALPKILAIFAAFCNIK